MPTIIRLDDWEAFRDPASRVLKVVADDNPQESNYRTLDDGSPEKDLRRLQPDVEAQKPLTPPVKRDEGDIQVEPISSLHEPFDQVKVAEVTNTQNDSSSRQNGDKVTSVGIHPKEEEQVEVLSDSCVELATLSSGMQTADSISFGVMFQVESKDTPLIIETMELNTNYLGDEQLVHCQVYEKPSNYKGFARVPNAWNKIAEVNMFTVKDGASIIPTHEFQSLHLEPHTQRSFYVTLTSADLQYSHVPTKVVGDVYTENLDLRVLVGGGLAEFPFAFSQPLLEPRVFSGIIHYQKSVGCSTKKRIATVSFTFLAQHDTDASLVVSQVNTIVKQTVTDLLETNSVLRNYVSNHSLRLIDSVTGAALSINGEIISECEMTSSKKCTGVVATVTLEHLDTVQKGDIKYELLRNRKNLSDNLNAAKTMNLQYIGSIPVEAYLVVQLDGVPLEAEMGTSQISYFEGTTKNFLKQSLQSKSSIDILRAEVLEQHKLGRNIVRATFNEAETPLQQLFHIQRRQLRKLQDDGSDKPQNSTNPKNGGGDKKKHEGVLDVVIKITGEYRPPPFVEFSHLTEDAIDDWAKQLRRDLVLRRGAPGFLESREETDFFRDISDLRARPVNGTDRQPDIRHARKRSLPPPGEDHPKGWALWEIMALTFFLTWVGYKSWEFYTHKRNEYLAKKHAKQVSETNRKIDSYMLSVYQQAFGAFERPKEFRKDGSVVTDTDEDNLASSKPEELHTERVANRVEETDEFVEQPQSKKASSRGLRVLSTAAAYFRHEKERVTVDVVGSSRALIDSDEEDDDSITAEELKDSNATDLGIKLRGAGKGSSRTGQFEASTRSLGGSISGGVPLGGVPMEGGGEQKEAANLHAMDYGFVKITPKPKGSKVLREAREEMWAAKEKATTTAVKSTSKKIFTRGPAYEATMRRTINPVGESVTERRVHTNPEFEAAMLDVHGSEYPPKKNKLKSVALALRGTMISQLIKNKSSDKGGLASVVARASKESDYKTEREQFLASLGRGGTQDDGVDIDEEEELEDIPNADDIMDPSEEEEEEEIGINTGMFQQASPRRRRRTFDERMQSMIEQQDQQDMYNRSFKSMKSSEDEGKIRIQSSVERSIGAHQTMAPYPQSEDGRLKPNNRLEIQQSTGGRVGMNTSREQSPNAVDDHLSNSSSDSSGRDVQSSADQSYHTVNASNLSKHHRTFGPDDL